MQEKLITAPSDDDFLSSDDALAFGEEGEKVAVEVRKQLRWTPKKFGSHYYPINEQKRIGRVHVPISAQVN